MLLTHLVLTARAEDPPPEPDPYADIEEIIVTPGSFSMMRDRDVSSTSISGDQARELSFSEDPTRAVTRFPGVSASDFSSKFIVRGGEDDEVLVTLDGMQLLEPFHQRDYSGGLFSVVDIGALQGIDLSTGGFPADFGNRLSGVFQMHSRDNVDGDPHASVSLSVLNASAATDGKLARGHGEWLLTARRTTLDVVLPTLGYDEVLPSYWDGFGKLSWKLSDDVKLSLEALHSGDHTLVDNGDVDFYDLRYHNTYSWLTLSAFPTEHVHVSTMLYGSFLDQDRTGYYFKYDYTDKGSFDVSDRRSYRQLGLKHDWYVHVSDALSIRSGIEGLREDARYDYHAAIDDLRVDTTGQLIDYVRQTDTQLEPGGERASAYVTGKLGLLDRVYLEGGGRADVATSTGQILPSPRVAAALAITDRTFLRGAWGTYYQTPYLYEIDVEHGAERVPDAARADHLVANLEHRMRNGLEGRLEGYWKDYSHLAPQWQNLRDQWEVFPESRNDDVHVFADTGTSRGIEVFLKYDEGAPVSFWASYALAEAYVNVDHIDFEGLFTERTGKVPRLNDQRHTINLDLNLRPTPLWQISAAWQYYTGWVRTTYTYDVEPLANGDLQFYAVHDVYNGVKYPAYHRLDLRVSRDVPLRLGMLTVYAQVVNAYDRKNLRKFDLDAVTDDEQPSLDANGDYVPFRDDVNWLGITPILGVAWGF
ncbi:MAG: TonB-dependent receptor plug domain-containing protein [Myxococcales bacterium]|nr:TonB-dependent receptor plug domain-containing protein [Myxococcales bacterium]